MELEISSALLDHLLKAAEDSPGREICGLLFGSPRRIERAEPCRNVAVQPERAFEIDPAALFAALRSQRAGRARMIGHYHSHPTGAAAPSPRDAAQASGDGAIWLILGGGDATAWRSVEAGVFEAVVLRLRDVA